MTSKSRARRWRAGAPGRGCRRGVDRVSLTPADIVSGRPAGGWSRGSRAGYRRRLDRFADDWQRATCSSPFEAIDSMDTTSSGSAARGALGVMVETPTVEAARAMALGRQDLVIVGVPDAHMGRCSRSLATCAGVQARRSWRSPAARKDDDQGSGGGVSVGALSRVSEQGQSEQSHRPAALAPRIAVET